MKSNVLSGHNTYERKGGWFEPAKKWVKTTREMTALHAAVQRQLNQDPLSGHLFLFTNRLRNRIKLLYWDGSGLWVCARRLERGRFSWPEATGVSTTLRGEELTALVSGLEVRGKADWYRR